MLMAQQSLEELLIRTKLISPQQLAVVQRDAETRNLPLAYALIDLGFVDDRKFAQWMAGATNLPLVDPVRPDVVEHIASHVPAGFAREHLIVPIDVDGDEMTVVTIDPLDKTAIDALHEATGMKIHPVIGIRSQLADIVNRIYPKQPEFDPSATVSVAIEREPFEFGDETMLRHHSLEFAYAQGDDSLGSETRILPVPATAPAVEDDTNPVTEVQPQTQLDRIEQRLGELVHAVEGLQRRIDAMDAVLARIINRQ